ncbi:MAG TPA: HAD-IA family hydrolase [Candidatus Nanoarchaeia archaeon]|nr:pyrophosphatase PpaX [uncultured archaeon]
MLTTEELNKLTDKEIILDFEGVITKIDLDWEALRQKIVDLLGLDRKLNFSSLYLYSQVKGKRNEYLKMKAEAEIAGLTSLPSELFEYFKKNNLAVTIFSANTREAIETYLKDQNFMGNVKTLVAIDNVDFIKPHPEGLLKIVGNKNPNDFVLIGDSVYDAIAAKLAGVQFQKYELEK